MLRTLLIGSLLLALLSGCIFSPKTASQQPYSEQCNMQTRRLSLSTNNISGSYVCHGSTGDDAKACLAAFGIVVPAGSFIISGSIVVANNSLHWLEYHGTCDQGLLNEVTHIFKRKTRQSQQ
ncbi:hypothetical protein [Dasania marina]|uniref:hypothetical protein n=1 Tax=Dasania marina TaxID=471499 RepID=UPI0030D840E4|tara:strand:+ start:12177 stop:12542 length:366 start_codon:yes stop_codon:yes gene_type:complete